MPTPLLKALLQHEQRTKASKQSSRSSLALHHTPEPISTSTIFPFPPISFPFFAPEVCNTRITKAQEVFSDLKAEVKTKKETNIKIPLLAAKKERSLMKTLCETCM
jgi:hypothetical protein